MNTSRTSNKPNREHWTGVGASLGAMALGLCLLGSAASAAESEGLALLRKQSQAFSEVAKQAQAAVVFVKVEKDTPVPEMGGQLNDPFEFFGDDFMQRFFGQRIPQGRGQPGMPYSPRKHHQEGLGSGFIISSDGYILTNNHVVGDADRITVKLADDREFTAKRVGTDPQTDVAVIKIDATGLPVLKTGDSAKLQVGEWVMAVGNPFGLAQTVTVGVVSAKGRSAVRIADYEDFIQTDAAINPGNSGGPLVNLEGEAVGINTAIFSRSGGYMGIGFAIPINLAMKVCDQLKTKGSVSRGYLGIMIQNLEPELAQSLGVPGQKGILVAEVSPDSPAAKAGFKPRDIIVDLNGRPVEETGHFRNTIAMSGPGSETKITILRDGRKETLNVTLGELTAKTDANGQSVETAATGTGGKYGLYVQELTADLADRFNLAGQSGVLVSRVEEGSSAARAGLEPGCLIVEVNQEKTPNTAAFREAMEKAKDKDSVLLLVRQQGGSRFVVLKK